MHSSSLFLRSSTTFVAFIASLSAVLAAPTTTATSSYSLQTTYAGSNFFSGFSFFTAADPTHGFVTYVSQSQAQSMGLITATDGQPVRIGVDYTNKYDGTKTYYNVNGVGRPSVRITSNQQYNHGLFIADIANMPGGVCGTWPALWTLGDGTWPYHGEIDIIEGVNTQTQALSSLHTAGKCNVPSYPSTETGTIQTTNCTYDTNTGANSAGCGVLDGDTSSFGLNFNSMGGGVFAWEWTSYAIRAWFFRRNAIPSDITNGAPKPSGWGSPYVNFQGDCSIDSNFLNHQIIFDTTFCGDWAGSVWGSSCQRSTGVSSCSVYVGNNPSAFKNMYWSINSLKVYSNQSSKSTTSSTTTTTTTTTRSTTSKTSSTTTTATTSPTTTTKTTTTTTPTTTKTTTTTPTTTTTTATPTTTTTTTILPTTTTTITTTTSLTATTTTITSPTSTLTTTTSTTTTTTSLGSPTRFTRPPPSASTTTTTTTTTTSASVTAFKRVIQRHLEQHVHGHGHGHQFRAH